MFEWILLRRAIKMKGKLLVLSGIDGSGKSTQEEYVARILSRASVEFVTTKQPTNWYRNLECVRSFLQSGTTECDVNTIALLAAADRMQHIDTIIRPNLVAGRWVVCNRYVYSTFAYFEARGADLDFVRMINSKVVQPDLGILITVDPGVAVQRVRERDKGDVKCEERDPDYLGRVQESLLRHWPSENPVFDGNQDIGAVAASIEKYILQHLP